jgi:CRISPR/Cas system-associated exonuclease Cas4 (RecB family)
MISTPFLLTAIVFLTLVTWLALRSYGRRRWLARESFPADLKLSTLWASEKRLACRYPVPLHGQVDQVFRTPNGALCPVDTKSHSRAYPSDILQLSVYAFILRHRRRWGVFPPVHVTSHGYIRLAGGNRIRYQRVNLLDDARIIDYHHRYHQLLKNRTSPMYCRSPNFCRRCAYRKMCNNPA